MATVAPTPITTSFLKVVIPAMSTVLTVAPSSANLTSPLTSRVVRGAVVPRPT